MPPGRGVPQTISVPGISIAGLLGTVGGNLGMFTGMSVMTIFEWLEASQMPPSASSNSTPTHRVPPTHGNTTIERGGEREEGKVIKRCRMPPLRANVSAPESR